MLRSGGGVRVGSRRLALLVGAAMAAGLAVAAAIGLTSCWSLSDPLPATTTGAGGSGGGGASSTTGGGGTHVGGGGGAEPCVPAKPPDAPSSTGATTAGGFIFAIRSVRFQTGQGGDLGYDLDDLCTCPDPRGCVTDVDAGAHCDEPGGRDNTLGPSLNQAITILLGNTAGEILTDGAETGQWSVLLEVEQLNLPDDPQVQVIAQPAAACCGGAGPTWNGTDPWPTEEGAETFTADEAYLSSNRLVARFSAVELHMRRMTTPTLKLSVRMSNAVLSASLDTSSDPARLVDGVVTGQVTQEELFRGLDSIQFDSNALCRNNGAYPAIKQTVCDNRDLTTGDSTSPCEGASLALGFTADEVGSGGSAAIPPKFSCSAGQYPEGDTCE
ncbi:MAG: hypothetical protein JRI23_13680 [Deltaproteobacteria bacterium]|jgi:hypothetical protein|nr:hypothetical protein [Deltaproteobacteria bacterium]MBW2532779.1 hypothetical protein [Deltaproteobacteria bacterium]